MTDSELREKWRIFRETGEVVAYARAMDRAGRTLEEACKGTSGAILPFLRVHGEVCPRLTQARDELTTRLLGGAVVRNDLERTALVTCYAALGRPEDAGRAIANTDFPPFDRLASAAARAGHFDQARDWARRVRGTQRGETRAHIAKYAARHNIWGQAKRQASYAGVQRNYAFVLLAIEAARQSRWAEAFTYLPQGYDGDSARTCIASLLGEQGDWQQAENILKRTISDHDQQWGYIWLAHEASRQGAWSRAEDYIPTGTIFVEWGYHHIVQGAAERSDWDRAKRYCDESGSRQLETQVELCVIAARQGDIQLAESLVPTEHFREYGLVKLAATTGNVGYALAAGEHRDDALAGCAGAMITQGRINDALQTLGIVNGSQTHARVAIVRSLNNLDNDEE